jgi:hypothetical protein
MSFRTDRNNNPAAITTDVAKQGGLALGVEYELGDPFPAPSTLVTAKLIGDPIALTIKVIDKIGYITKSGAARWTYINIPNFVWDACEPEIRKEIIHYHYKHEGGTELESLFV